MTNTNAVNPDGPYPRENLIQHPEHGELVPVAELLDDIHASVRAQEIIRQHENPQAEGTPIPEAEAVMEAGLLLTSLESLVQAWGATEEKTLEDGRVLRNYTMLLDNLIDSGYRSASVQLVYKNKEASEPVYGNAAVVMTPNGKEWPREHYFQAATEKMPHIYYAGYPWHEEELAHPQKDTVDAVTGAEHVISLLPHSN